MNFALIINNLYYRIINSEGLNTQQIAQYSN